MAELRTVPWSRFIGEFLVIVVGVLAALGVDSWRERQQEDALGQAYLRGLLTDLTADSTRLDDIGLTLQGKHASLDVLVEVAWGRSDVAPDSVVQLLLPSALLGWRIPAVQNAAYEELKSTGALRLIANPELRSQIVHYYEDWEHQLERLDRHRSSYPNAVYRLAPAAVLSRDEPLGSEGVELVSRLRSRDMRDQLNHETNYAALLTERHAVFEESVRTLLRLIRQQLR